MKSITALFTAALLAGTASAAYASDTDNRIQALEDQIQALSKQVEELKASAKEQEAQVKTQQAEIQKQQTAQQAKVAITNGRLSVSSQDGNFTAAIRALVQFDAGYYMQQKSAASLPTAYGPDLSSGTNMRRVFLGLQGKVFGDWSYYFLYDFGGAATETPAHIMYAYLEYDGLAPWALRVGAFAPPSNIEDSTASSDLLFFERNSPSNLQRNIAGSEGRAAISVLYTGERMFGALSLSGNKVQDGAKAWAPGTVANYDEQLALVSRLAYLPVSTSDAHWLVGVNGTYVIKPPDLIPNGTNILSTSPLAPMKSSYGFADPPEFTVDSNGISLVNTGALSARHVSQWGVETAGNYQNFYAQAGYYAYSVERGPLAYTVYSAADAKAAALVQPGDNHFNGWYLQASWVLTGESKGYSSATAAFTAPKPAQPFSLKDGGIGAWEIAARYSDLNLNSHVYDATAAITGWTAASRTYTFYNTVRGGDQRIATFGLNWYPNAALKFALDYQWIDAKRLQAPAAVTTAGTPVLPALNGGQTVQAISFRAQLGI